MEETCEYCGSEIFGDAIHHSDGSFCSQDCAEAVVGGTHDDVESEYHE